MATNPPTSIFTLTFSTETLSIAGRKRSFSGLFCFKERRPHTAQRELISALCKRGTSRETWAPRESQGERARWKLAKMKSLDHLRPPHWPTAGQNSHANPQTGGVSGNGRLSQKEPRERCGGSPVSAPAQLEGPQLRSASSSTELASGDPRQAPATVDMHCHSGSSTPGPFAAQHALFETLAVIRVITVNPSGFPPPSPKHTLSQPDSR